MTKFALMFETTGLHPSKTSNWKPEVVYACVVQIGNVGNWRGVYSSTVFDPACQDAIGAARVHKLDFDAIRQGLSPSDAAFEINRFTNGARLVAWDNELVARFFGGTGFAPLLAYFGRDVKTQLGDAAKAFDRTMQHFGIDGPYEPITRCHARTVQLAKLAEKLGMGA